MSFFLFEKLQSWRYIRPLPTPPTANRSRWYTMVSPADARRNPRASRRKSVASNSSLPTAIVRRVRSSLGLAETGKGRRRGAAATTTSPSPPPFKASHSSSLPYSPTPFDDRRRQHRHRKGTIVYDRFKSALQQLFAPSPGAEMERKRGQKTTPSAAATAVGASTKTKRKRRRKGERRRRSAKKSSQLGDDGDDEDELLISPPSNLPRRRRREVRITPAKIPTIPAPVWPEYLYSYDDGGDSARRRTIFAPAASNLNFGLVTHSIPIPDRKEKRRGGERERGGRGPSIWHLLLRSINGRRERRGGERCTLLGQVL